MTADSKRRWSFSLRTMLIIVLAVGGLAGLGIREALRRNQEQIDRQQIQEARQEAWLRNDPRDSDF